MGPFKKNNIRIAAFLLAVICVLGGCAKKDSAESLAYMQTPSPSAVSTPPAKDAKADVISYIYTTKRAFAITFSEMADKSTMDTILDRLDQYNMKALFYLQGMRVAEEPDIANEILRRGHEIGNAELDNVDLTELDYSDIYDEIQKGSKVIKEKTGVSPRYLWNRGGKYNDDVLFAADACGLDLVKYTINLQSWEDKSAAEVKSYLENQDPDCALKTIDLIAKVSEEMGYSVSPMDDLIASSYERKPLTEIPGWDAASVAADTGDGEYQLIYNGVRSKKIVCLTFDDWGGDLAVTRILDKLDQYKVKATFFLRGDGVEANPNLAKAIAEAGHDVANHTYSHPVLTDITPDEVQEEVVKCHQVLTEAIQKQPAMLFRPPTGEIDRSAAKAIGACGYGYISLYDVSPDDWNTENDADDITNYVKQNCTSGSIIVLHLMIQLDTYKALPQMIEYFQDKGYEILPLSQMIADGDVELSTQLPSAS
jgi:peptidoglycan/xylan/chitin deacetylase (PgdA/CDA1 family)